MSVASRRYTTWTTALIEDGQFSMLGHDATPYVTALECVAEAAREVNSGNDSWRAHTRLSDALDELDKERDHVG